MKQLMYLAAVGAQAASSAMLIPVLTHNLSPADYGTVGIVVVLQQLVTMVVGLGLPGLITSWESGGSGGELQRGAALPVVLLGALGTAAAIVAESMTFFVAVLVGSVNAVSALVLARLAARGMAGVWAALTVAIGPVAIGLAAWAAALTGSLHWYLTTWALGVIAAACAALRWADADWFQPTSVSAARRRTALSLPLTFSLIAGVVLWSGDRLVVAATLGTATLASYQAAYTVGQLAATAGATLTNHWLPRLMRGDPRARRSHLLIVTALAVLGAVAAGPVLVVLLPTSYDPWHLWPVSAIAALSAIPLCLYLQVQARATYLGRTRTVGLAGVVVIPLALGTTLVLAELTGSLIAIAGVTPASYLALAVYLRLRVGTSSEPSQVPVDGGPRPILVLLSSIRWDYLWQRHQSLAAAGTEMFSVVFVESQPRRLRQLLAAPVKPAGVVCDGDRVIFGAVRR